MLVRQSDFETQTPAYPSEPAYLEEHVGKRIIPGTYEHEAHFLVRPNSSTEPYICMHTNDYLSLAGDLRIAQEKAAFLLSNGHGDAISRVFTHDKKDNLREFENRFARLLGAEDAVLLMSGYNANTGLIQAYAAPNSVVYIDQRAHGSFWDGILCARASARPFRHNNVDDLRRKIERYGPGLIAVDALYSTTGKIAPLEDLVRVAEEGECAIVVDETHSFGCHGADGAGLVAEFGLAHRVHFRTVGLSKAIAARGGVVVGSKCNIEYFRYEARPIMFSTSVLGYEVAGFQKTLDIIADEKWRQTRLHSNHKLLKEGIADLGYDVSASDSQIIGVVIGPNERAAVFKNYLEMNGIAAAPFAPPATPQGQSMMRFTVNAALDQEQIDHTLSVFASAKRDLDTSDWICFRN